MNERQIGPYRLEERLGSGGMGAVYKAWDERLGRWVAVKSILPHKELSEERIERFRREARSAARLNHPAIAQVHDLISHGGRDHIVMELVEGKSLEQLLADGPLAPEQAVKIARQVAEGLDAAHEHGIVHRDLKAGNVMVDRRGHVKILDFGLAKVLHPDPDDDSLTEEGMVIGTCRAMSPEQAEGKPVDHRSDLFSLGSLLYQMVTGEHPFASTSPMATMHRVVFDEPRRAASLAPDVPVELTQLIHRLLAKDPDQRPPGASAVAGRLQDIATIWTAPSSSHGHATSDFEAYRRRAAWRRLAWVGGITLVIAAAAGVPWWLTRPPAPPRVVAVLEPLVAGESSAELTAFPADALRTALVNGTTSLSGLLVPDTREVDGAAGTPVEIARAVAADEALVSEIAGCDPICRVELRRVAADGQLLPDAVRSFDVPAEDLILIARAATGKLHELYPDRPTRAGFRALDADPASFAAYLRIMQELNDPSAGSTREVLLDELGEIRRRAPGFLESHLAESYLARYLFEITNDEAYLVRAREAVERAEQLAPEDLRPLARSFDVFRAAGELDQAAAVLDELERRNPSDPQILERRGLLAMRRGDSERAIALLEQLVAVRPSWRNYGNLANTELRSGKPEAAEAHLVAGLERSPRNRNLLKHLALLHIVSGKAEEAEAEYASLAAQSPDVASLSNLGFARLLLGRYAEAIESFEAARRLSPFMAAIELNLGDCHALLGDSNTARSHYQAALTMATEEGDPSSVDSLGVAAQCYAHLGQVQPALNAVRRQLELSPDDPQTHFDAAIVHAVIGEKATAVYHGIKALELGITARWFDLPWFTELHDDPEFKNAVEPNPGDR